MVSKLTPAANDALTLLLPPPELADWLGTVIAKRLNNGERVPDAYMRWLYRVQMIRLCLPRAETGSMDDSDWASIDKLEW